MEIKNLEEIVPFISRVVIGLWFKEKETDTEYNYIDNIKPYITLVSEKLGLDYNKLYNDLKSNVSLYYTDPYQEAMKSEELLTSVIDDSRKIWMAFVKWDSKSGEVKEKGKKSIFARLNVHQLYDAPFLSDKKKIKGDLKPRKSYSHKGKVTLEDVIYFYSEVDFSTIIWFGGARCLYDVLNPNNKDYQTKIFSTEKEADDFLSSIAPKVKAKKKTKEELRIEKTYGAILKEVEKLDTSQIEELIKILENRFDKIVDSEDLNPLEIAMIYRDKATGIDSYIIPKEYATRDWIEENMDPNRYETIEYEDILDRILDGYPEDVKWEDISEEDQEVIEEISGFLKDGEKGFKFDW